MSIEKTIVYSTGALLLAILSISLLFDRKPEAIQTEPFNPVFAEVSSETVQLPMTGRKADRGPPAIEQEREVLVDDKLREENVRLKARNAELREENRLVRIEIEQLKRKLQEPEAKVSFTKFAKERESTEKQLLFTLDNSALFSDKVDLFRAITATTTQNIEYAMELEKDFVKEYAKRNKAIEHKSYEEQIEDNKDDGVVGKWLKKKLKSLETELIACGIPKPQIKNFIDNHK